MTLPDPSPKESEPYLEDVQRTAESQTLPVSPLKRQCVVAEITDRRVWRRLAEAREETLPPSVSDNEDVMLQWESAPASTNTNLEDSFADFVNSVPQAL